MVKLPQDFKDFLKLLNSHGVEYLIVGGYAVGLHGYPRATGDMDIWIAVDAETARTVFKLIDALEDSDEVQNVYANFDISPEVLAELEA
jgi:hypothetical protein